MIRNTFFLFAALLFTFAFQASAQRSNDAADKSIESIVGKWQLQKVYAGSREITSNPNSEGSWIEFNEDGRYRIQAEDSDEGSYRLNENHSILYLESEQRKETSSAVSLHNLTEYNIVMRDGTLTMQSRNSNAGSTKYVYARSAGESEPDNDNK
jgi:predicted transcriptional regulator of viral defense system